MSTIAVVARPDLADAGPLLRELVSWLRGRQVQVCLEERTAGLMDGPAACTVAPGKEAAASADALVVLGGDGTLLRAAQILDRPGVPVLGVNFGSLGFLTEITLSDLYPSLESVLAGSYAYDERQMLSVVLRRQGQPDRGGDVLNDVVITKSSFAGIIELEVMVDGLFVSSFWADGLIVSSPTGSTAYNLSAGGPILHPTLPAIVLTPICPHMLSNRPLVVSDETTIEVRVLESRPVEIRASLDGQEGHVLGNQDTVVVSRSPRTLRLVKAPGRDFFEVLRTKLKWGEPTARRR